jgi:hypothetical protein
LFFSNTFIILFPSDISRNHSAIGKSAFSSQMDFAGITADCPGQVLYPCHGMESVMTGKNISHQKILEKPGEWAWRGIKGRGHKTQTLCGVNVPPGRIGPAGAGIPPGY